MMLEFEVDGVKLKRYSDYRTGINLWYFESGKAWLTFCAWDEWKNKFPEHYMHERNCLGQIRENKILNFIEVYERTK